MDGFGFILFFRLEDELLEDRIIASDDTAARVSTEIGGRPRVWRVPNGQHLIAVAFPPTSYAQPVSAVKNGVRRV